MKKQKNLLSLTILPLIILNSERTLKYVHKTVDPSQNRLTCLVFCVKKANSGKLSINLCTEIGT